MAGAQKRAARWGSGVQREHLPADGGDGAGGYLRPRNEAGPGAGGDDDLSARDVRTVDDEAYDATTSYFDPFHASAGLDANPEGAGGQRNGTGEQRGHDLPLVGEPQGADDGRSEARHECSCLLRVEALHSQVGLTLPLGRVPARVEGTDVIRDEQRPVDVITGSDAAR